MPPDVGLAPSYGLEGPPGSPSAPPAPLRPLPHISLGRLSWSIAKRARGVGARGRGSVGREELWLKGRVLQLQYGEWGGTFQRAVGARPTSRASREKISEAFLGRKALAP